MPDLRHRSILSLQALPRKTASPRATAVVALLAGLLTGCAAGPDYVRPEVDIPAAYKEASPAVTGAQWQPAQPADTLPPSEWWTVFGDATLNGLMAQQARQSPTIAQAVAQYRQAQALLDQAQAGLWPTLSLNASGTRGVSAPGAATANQFAAGLSASWVLDLWGNVRRSIEVDSAKARVSAAQLAGARLSAQAQLATAYLQLVATDRQLAQMQQSEAALQEALQLTQNQYRAGTVSDGTVAQAQSQLQSLQAQWFDKQLARTQLEHAVAAALGLPPANLRLAAAQQPPTLPHIPPGLPSQMLQRRPDIAAAERNLAAANAQIGLTETAYFPALTLGASIGARSSVIGNLLSAPQRIWSLGPALLLSVWDSGARRAQTAQAQVAYDASVAAYRQTVMAAFQSVEDLLAAQHLLAQEAAVQAQALAAAQRAETIAMNQYKAGIVSYLNVLSAQSTRLTAENALWAVKSRQYTSAVALVAATGGGWDGVAGTDH